MNLENTTNSIRSAAQMLKPKNLKKGFTTTMNNLQETGQAFMSGRLNLGETFGPLDTMLKQAGYALGILSPFKPSNNNQIQHPSVLDK